MLSVFKGSTSVNNININKKVRNYLVIDEISISNDSLHWWTENASNLKTLNIVTAKDLLVTPVISTLLKGYSQKQVI